MRLMVMNTLEGEYLISEATVADLRDLLVLQKENLIANGGLLSIEFSSIWFERSMAEMPIMIGRREGRLVGYLVSSSRDASRHLALPKAKYAAYPASEDAYNSGPLCIAASERGRGLAPMLFQAMRARLPGREAVGFVRCDNAPSRALHRKLGFSEVAEFLHEGIRYVVTARE